MPQQESRSLQSTAHHIWCYLQLSAMRSGLQTLTVTTGAMASELGYTTQQLHKGLRVLRDDDQIKYKAPKGCRAASRPFTIEMIEALEVSRPIERPAPALAAASIPPPIVTPRPDASLLRPADLSRYAEMSWDQFLSASRQARSLKAAMQAKWDWFCNRYRPADLQPTTIHGVWAGQIKHLQGLICSRLVPCIDEGYAIKDRVTLLVPAPLPPREQSAPVQRIAQADVTQHTSIQAAQPSTTPQIDRGKALAALKAIQQNNFAAAQSLTQETHEHVKEQPQQPQSQIKQAHASTAIEQSAAAQQGGRAVHRGSDLDQPSSGRATKRPAGASV